MEEVGAWSQNDTKMPETATDFLPQDTNQTPTSE
jgi:hypothetical protein